MTIVDLLWHLAGLLAPAWVLAPLMVLFSQPLAWGRPRRARWPVQLGINLLACMAVLVLGLIWTGEDGRWATYAALVITSAACQAWLGGPKNA